MGHLFWLSDEAWAAIQPHLPTKGFRRVATHCDKLAANFLSAVELATIIAFWV